MRLLTIILASTLLAACSKLEPLLDQIKRQGELLVVTRNSPTTYYEGPDGLTGLEYDLVQLFAKRLGVKVRYIIPDSFTEILPMIARREAHLAAAGLTMTEARESQVRFGPSYQEITQQLIYRIGTYRPRNITDTVGTTLEIIAGSSHEETLIKLKKIHPELEWEARNDVESEELLYLLREQVIDYTIADSNEAALNRRYYQELKPAIDLTAPQPLAWAFPHSQDSSLYNEALAFFKQIQQEGTLKQLVERHYGHVEKLNFVDKRTFKRHIASRLPKFKDLFMQAAEETGIDWKLLAAIGYQESHWNPKAKSPTGVRGLMMLTLATAKQLGIKSRLDPKESILGGSRYINALKKKIPERIEDPDRLWMALAGYNLGFGHLEDARILTQKRGGNPDKWVEIKQTLPLLINKKWYKKTRYGYARGHEAITYVDSIRSYYDILTWLESKKNKKSAVKKLAPLTVAPAVL
ncbi:Membrane-bound lytic murein transglycosylase F (EC 4.2.2.n1) [hydrothermal vent metagenome]|uniref:Membrane-bound lytic murein transglycosylase F n=1 Tax=hydrothermal vent metagenome TaxID=652676 RepID=A0A3B1AI77_9ZZZZ